MTNELGLELDKQAQYDVTKEEALKTFNEIKKMLNGDDFYKISDMNKCLKKLKQYIEERP